MLRPLRRVAQGCDPKQYRQQYEEKLRTAEMEAIQDYIAENDNLVTLHKEVSRRRIPLPLNTLPAVGCLMQPPA